MYLPFLRSKRAELLACSKLSPRKKAIISPTVVLATPSEATRAASSTPAVRWANTSSEFAIFSFHVDRETAGFAQAIQDELDPSASVRLAVALHDYEALEESIRDYNAAFRHGVLIELHAADCSKPQSLRLLDSIRRQMPLQLAVMEPVISQGTNAEHLAAYIAFSIQYLVADGFDNIAFVGGSYPKDNTALLRGGVSSLPRIEWHVYQALKSHFPELHFGDFVSISAQEPSGFAGAGVLQSPAIRYATPDTWEVHRGVPTAADEWQQAMTDLAFAIIREPYFRGQTFSWGDKRIYDMALDVLEAPRRNWEKIRAIEINHHLTLACQQVAGLFVPEVAPSVSPEAEE